MDGPYIDGIKEQLEGVFDQPQVWLAGYGYTAMTTGDAHLEFHAYCVNPYGQGVIDDMRLRLESVNDGTEHEFSLTAIPSGRIPGCEQAEFYFGSIDLNSTTSNTFNSHLSIAKSEWPDGLSKEIWPDFTIYDNKVPIHGQENSGTVAYNEQLFMDLISQNTNQAPQVVEYSDAIKTVLDVKDRMEAQGMFSRGIMERPIIFTAGYLNSRLIEFYPGNFIICAGVYHPEKVPIENVRFNILINGSYVEGIPMQRVWEDGKDEFSIYTFAFTTGVGVWPFMEEDWHVPVEIVVEDENGRLSDIWPQVSIHDPEDPDNSMPAAHLDVNAPTFQNRAPVASSTHFYTDKLALEWTAFNTHGQKAIDGEYDVYLARADNTIFNMIAHDVTTQYLLIDNLEDCTLYKFQIPARDFSGHDAGLSPTGYAYTGYPEIPYGLTASGSDGNYMLEWEIRNTYTPWEEYEVIQRASSGELQTYAYVTEPRCPVHLQPGGIVCLMVRINQTGDHGEIINGCPSREIGVCNDETTISHNSVIFVDTNDDGYLDALVDNSSGGCSLFRQDSENKYHETGFSLDQPVSNIKTTDLNGDLRPDLICIESTKINILVNNAGTFSEVDNIVLTNTSRKAVAADLDKDGKKELIVVKDENVIVAKDDAVDGYKIEQTLESSDNIMVESSDLNNDASIDLVTATGTGVLSIFLNNGTGDMNLSTEIITGHPITRLNLTDIDLDWDLDILVTIDSGTELRYINDGEANFTLN